MKEKCKTEGCKSEVAHPVSATCQRCYMALYRGQTPRAKRPPLPKGRCVQVFMPESLLKKLALIGVEQSLTRGAMVRSALEAFVAKTRTEKDARG